MKLALGTAQFGLPYGIANQLGQVDLTEAKSILHFAKIQGINTLDTAIAYGNSEETLGQINVADFNIISKLPPYPDNCKDLQTWVEEQVSASLKRLKITKLEGLLLHRPEQLLLPNGKALYQALCSLKEKKLVSKIGVSIYQPSELDALFAVYNTFDLVQAPFNILDRSLIHSGWLKKLHDTGTEVHVRSIFLQGLLLMAKNHRPEKFKRWQPLWNIWDEWLEQTQTSALEACLLYPLAIPEISKVVVGIDNLAQLKHIVSAASKLDNSLPPELFQSQDPQLINPALWGNL